MTLIAHLGRIKEAVAGLVVIDRRAIAPGPGAGRLFSDPESAACPESTSARGTLGRRSTAAAAHIDSHLTIDLLRRRGNAHTNNVANNRLRPRFDGVIRRGLRAASIIASSTLMQHTTLSVVCFLCAVSTWRGEDC